jgi:hypothetical protein
MTRSSEVRSTVFLLHGSGPRLGHSRSSKRRFLRCPDHSSRKRRSTHCWATPAQLRCAGSSSASCETPRAESSLIADVGYGRQQQREIRTLNQSIANVVIGGLIHEAISDSTPH